MTFPAVARALAASSTTTFRVLQYSVQTNHVHLIVEADRVGGLSRGIQGLAIRIAKAVNQALGRRGRLWEERFHARTLATPRELRHALVYVLNNFRKHLQNVRGLDPCSSARWFVGWRNRLAPAPGTSPVAPPQTWLARVGWWRHGRIDVGEGPRPARR
jgi:hypothetical protein